MIQSIEFLHRLLSFTRNIIVPANHFPMLARLVSSKQKIEGIENKERELFKIPLKKQLYNDFDNVHINDYLN